METNHFSPLADISIVQRIPTPVCETASSMEINSTEDVITRTTSRQYSGSEVSRNRYNREVPHTEQEFSLEFLHDSGGHKEKTHIKLPTVEPVPSVRAFQDGGCPSPEGNHREERLYLQDRSERCIRSSAHPSPFKKIFDLSERRHSLSIPISGLWSQYRSENLQQDYEIRHRTFTQTGHQINLLSGRHMYSFTDQGRYAEYNYTGNESSSVFGFYYQYTEKLFNSRSGTGIPRFPLQFKEDDHFSPSVEDYQALTTYQASTSSSNREIMSMDGQFAGENDFTHTSHWGSFITYPLPPTRFIQEPDIEQSQLGKPMPLVLYQPRGTQLVERICYGEERSSYPDDQATSTEDYYICGCFRHGMGNCINHTGDMGLLDGRRTNAINKRTRANDNLFCLEAPCRKVPRIDDPNFQRQYYRSQVRNESRGDFIDFAPRLSNQDTKHMQHLQPASDLSTHTRSEQYSSRYTQQSEGSSLRSSLTTSDISSNTTEMGTIESRRICNQSQHQTKNILEPKTRPRSHSVRCIPTEMAQDRYISQPTVEIDPQGFARNHTTTGETSGAGDAILANSVLVSDVTEDATTGNSSSIPDEKMDNGRMAIIWRSRKETGVSSQANQFLLKSTRNNTKKAYDKGWKRWSDWCTHHEPKLEPEEYNVHNVLEFLVRNQHYSYQYLNVMRSAIASVFKIIHPNKPALADQPLIADFFKAKRRTEVKIPSIQQLETWDLNLMTTYIQKTMLDSKNLSLPDLQQKALLLLCMATMGRPSSDIARLQHRDIHWEVQHSTVTGVTIHFREPKEKQVKTTRLGVLSDKTLCPTTTLFYFLEHSLQLRESLPEDHTLFLAYISKPYEVKSVRPKTVASWLKDHMAKAGIDTSIYTAHSFRSASSTKAVQQGHSIQSVKQHANWSLKSNTFEKYYYKPTAQQNASTAITNSIFSDPENSTTLGVEMEPTRIVVGTIDNAAVGGMETINVVQPTPWYRRLFW